MDLLIEDAGRPCQKCSLPLRTNTFDRTREVIFPFTITSCSNCGHISWKAEAKTEQSIMKRPASYRQIHRRSIRFMTLIRRT